MQQLPAQWRCHSWIKPHHLYTLVGVWSGEYWTGSSCQSKTKHPFKSWSFLIMSPGQSQSCRPAHKWLQSYETRITTDPNFHFYWFKFHKHMWLQLRFFKPYAKKYCVWPVCVHRSFTFQHLGPGSQYKIEVISTSGERRSKPATMILYTSKIHVL